MDKKDVPGEVSEADAQEQERSWRDDENDEENETRPREIPLDAPEADVLDQARSADLEDEEER